MAALRVLKDANLTSQDISAIYTGTNSTDIGKKILSLFGQNSGIKPVYLIMTGVTLILVIVFIILIVIAMRKNKKAGKAKKK